MKLFVALFLLAMMPALYAQEVQPEKNRRFSLSLGPSVYMAGSEAFVGGVLAFNFMPAPKHQLSAEIQVGSSSLTQIGSYGYTITTRNSSGQIIKTETFTDGEILYSYDVTNALISWNRLLALSEKWTFRIGPSIGLLSISGSDTYVPTSYEGTEIEGIPESQTELKYAFTGGVTFGLRWSFAWRWYLDLNYRVSANTGVNFPERSMKAAGQTVTLESREFSRVGNNIGLSLGWRF